MSTLQERLDRMRDGAAERIPAPAREVMSRATQALRDSEVTSRLPKPGDALPPFELLDTDERKVRSAELLEEGPLVLSFYRGLW